LSLFLSQLKTSLSFSKSLFCSKEVLWFFFNCLISFLFFLLPFRSLLIKFHEFCEIEFRFFDEFNLLKEYILKREYFSTLLLNSLSNRLLNEFAGKLFQSGLLSFADHDLHHLLANSFLLWVLGVASGSYLFWGPLCEPNGEHSQHVSIWSLGLNICLNNCVPFLDKLTQFIFCGVHSVEVCVAILSFNFFHLDLHFSPIRLTAILALKISQRYLKYSAFQTFRSKLLSGSLVARGDGGHSYVEDWRDMHIVPFFLSKWVVYLLLLTLLFEVSGVLSCCH